MGLFLNFCTLQFFAEKQFLGEVRISSGGYEPREKVHTPLPYNSMRRKKGATKPLDYYIIVARICRGI